MKSRFAIIGALAALLLALLYVAPVLASQGLSRIDGQGADYLGVAVLDPAAGTLAGPILFDPGASTTTDTDNVNVRYFNTASGGGLPADWAAAQDVAKYTKVGNTVWVAAASGTPWGTDTTDAGANPEDVPYSLVYISVTFREAPVADSTVTADVRNLTSGRSITEGDLTRWNANETERNDFPSPLYRGGLMLTNTGGTNVGNGSDVTFTGYFFVTKTQMELVGAQPSIVGNENDVIRITVDGKTRDVRVDATAPVISGTGPAHNTIQTGNSATFTGTITDTGSGTAPDGANEDAVNAPSDSAVGAADGDSDGVTAEPRALASPSGKARDIEINVDDRATAEAELNLDVSGEASTGWTQVDNGFRFAFTKAGLVTSGGVYWNVVAEDRVNNRAQTDADGAAGNKNNYLLLIDGANPGMGTVEAGRGYDAATKRTVPNASSIKVTFTAAGTAAGAADWLDAA
ncbi:MAG: hypothetical protein OXC14_13165, partial [Rhodospirillaceae bacterium]|nr:hypothetical protein [Rhodospirillaceae bacterium]